MKLIFGQKTNFQSKPLPEGEYRARVCKSEWYKDRQYEESVNPEGWALRLWIDVVNKDKRVFSTIPITKSLKLNKLRESAGLKPVGENDDFKAEELLNKIVTVHLKIYENNEKKLSNVINRFVVNTNVKNVQDEEDEVIEEKEEDLEVDSEGFPF